MYSRNKKCSIIDSGDNFIEYKFPSVIIRLQLSDMLKFKSDSIVNAANEECLGGGGIDGQITDKGGDSLAKARKKLSVIKNDIRCPTGEARLTISGDLSLMNSSLKIIAHAVAPRCDNDMSDDIKYLLSAAYYNTCLKD